MEDNKVIEMQKEETAVEVKKESKVKTIIGKVGSGVKRHWKTIAVGAGALAVGVVLGSKKSEPEDYEEISEEAESESMENESQE